MMPSAAALLEARDQQGRLRIEQRDDWVRQEIELALTSNRILIPVVFGLPGMLSREELTKSIAGLAGQRFVIVRDEFPDDLQPVLRQIELHLPGSADLNIRADIGEDPRKLPYPDPPMPIKPSPMSEMDINIALGELLKDWEVASGPLPGDSNKLRAELHRTFEFRNFLDVLAFMTKVADFADKTNHHPRWENIYETLDVYLTTWDIGHRISHLDVQLAQFFDRAYQSYCDQSIS
jgi:pterin-4a-carbinolamine dehydratase